MNMSYCRFENTYKDLRDCADALDDNPDEELSTDEEKYRRKLIKLCEEIASLYGENKMTIEEMREIKK